MLMFAHMLSTCKVVHEMEGFLAWRDPVNFCCAASSGLYMVYPMYICIQGLYSASTNRLWHVHYIFLCMHLINLQDTSSPSALTATSPVSAITLQPGLQNLR